VKKVVESHRFVSEQCRAICVEVQKGSPGGKFFVARLFVSRPQNFTVQLTEACAYYNRWVSSLLANSRRTKGVYGIRLTGYRSHEHPEDAFIIQRFEVAEPWDKRNAVFHQLEIARAPRLALSNPNQLTTKRTDNV
jgi:hypothetical protein